jgi:hypothetical protein
MSRIRFASIQALFETYPEALRNIRAEPTDEVPISFLQRLSAAGRPQDAIAVCAYLLPRREAVWWGCTCVRMLLGDKLQDDAVALATAEAWVQDPTDENRRIALDVGTKAAHDQPLTWLALAAGWSSGTFPSTPFPVPAFMTSRAVRIALLISIRQADPDERPKLLQSCLAQGIELAEAGP